jgi:hypothetical protein
MFRVMTAAREIVFRPDMPKLNIPRSSGLFFDLMAPKLDTSTQGCTD